MGGFMLSAYSPNSRSFDCSSQNCVVVSEYTCQQGSSQECRCNRHSMKEAVKLIQIFPSHVRLPLRLMLPGMLCVSNSSTLCNMPSLLRNPTTIFGTPSRNDCAHIRSNFRSNFTTLLSSRISSDVLSSTQFIGCSLSSGLQSHT